jgi:phosphate transport system protein
MDKMNLSKHISGQFNADLEGVRNQVMAMGGLVEQQLIDALRSIHKQDVSLARATVEKDKDVNTLEVQIDQACTQVVAKRQPAASDLRLIMMVIKTTADLERIGDVAVRLARMVERGIDKPHNPPLVSLEKLGQHTVSMLHNVLDGFARMDANIAWEVHQEDAEVDKAFESIMRELMTYMMEDPRSIPRVIDVVASARAIERVGDRCQNIAEYIIYFVKGKDVRHLNSNEIKELM